MNMNYKAMLLKIRSIHKKAGRSRLSIFRDVKDCAGYMDHGLFKLYDLTPEQRDTCLTRGRNNEIAAKYNDRACVGDLDHKARALVTEAAQVVPEVGYVGWDVCFTPDGPCLVEGNQFPGHDIYQFPGHTPDKIGIVPRFRAIEAEEAAPDR